LQLLLLLLAVVALLQFLPVAVQLEAACQGVLQVAGVQHQEQHLAGQMQELVRHWLVLVLLVLLLLQAEDPPPLLIALLWVLPQLLTGAQARLMAVPWAPRVALLGAQALWLTHPPHPLHPGDDPWACLVGDVLLGPHVHPTPAVQGGVQQALQQRHAAG
jgi:hypothetical protein